MIGRGENWERAKKVNFFAEPIPGDMQK